MTVEFLGDYTLPIPISFYSR